MTILNPIDKDKLSSGMAKIVDKFKRDPGYANGLQIFAHKQEVFEPIWAAYLNMLENGKLDRGLKELVRIKIAQNNDCSSYSEKSSLRRSPMRPDSVPGLSQEKILATSSYEVSDVLDRREKLALKFAEKLGIEPEGLDDEFFDLLRQEFTDPEIVELAHIIAVGIGFERFLAVWESRACAI
jgi:alkylhydroperoxidase family enzyme